MRTIFKYKIKPEGHYKEAYKIHIDCPPNSKLLTVMKQGDDVCVWAEVDDDKDLTDTLVLYCLGTGHGAVPPDTVYLNSVIDDAYVWHFYVAK